MPSAIQSFGTDLPETLALVKDLATLVLTGLGVFVAWSGLNTWKKQLHGTTEFELARRVLSCALALRETAKAVRFPAVTQKEHPFIARDWDSPEQTRAQWIAGAFEGRLQRMKDARVTLEGAMLEAEALWGRGVPDAGRRLLDLIAKLDSLTGLYIASVQTDSSRDIQLMYKMAMDRSGFDIFDSLNRDSPDAFNVELQASVAILEQELKEYLNRGNRSRKHLL